MAEIRRAVPADADAIAALEAEIYGPDAWSADTVEAELDREDRYYIAIGTDMIEGYAGLFLSRPDADIQTVTVAPQCRRQGLGRELLHHLLVRLREWDYSRVFLEVRSDNTAAIELYEQHGFRRIGLRRGYYAGGVDALNLRLRLGGSPRLGE
ncbi:MAG: ribosomal protein S18-alanine N-acetyltransferase [Actinobacteria bacterium]|nr:ribosomal protein S18-alanine N-acetyltransferase [Actinomycetota bacterium]